MLGSVFTRAQLSDVVIRTNYNVSLNFRKKMFRVLKIILILSAVVEFPPGSTCFCKVKALFVYLILFLTRLYAQYTDIVKKAL